MRTTRLISRCTLLGGLSLLYAMVVTIGCQGTLPPAEQASEEFHPRKLVIMPFKDMYKVFGENISSSHTCPLCGKVEIIGEVSEGAEVMLTQQLVEKLQQRADYLLIPPDQAQDLVTAEMGSFEKKVNELELLVKVGQEFKADAVLVSHIYRFRERLGTKYAAERPASVAFSLHLIQIPEGRIAWQRHFDETQRSLFEDLFAFGTFLKRGGRWITASEMATSGLTKILETFPKP